MKNLKDFDFPGKKVVYAAWVVVARGGREYRGALLGLCVIAIGITWIAATLFRT